MWTWQDTPETPSLPFDSLPYPTRTIRRRVRSVNHVTTKGKEVDHNLWVWGSVPRARGSPAIIQLKINNACAWMKRFFCFCFWKEKDTVRYYMMSLFCLKAIFSKLFRLRAVSLLLENPWAIVFEQRSPASCENVRCEGANTIHFLTTSRVVAAGDSKWRLMCWTRWKRRFLKDVWHEHGCLLLLVARIVSWFLFKNRKFVMECIA